MIIFQLVTSIRWVLSIELVLRDSTKDTKEHHTQVFQM